MDRLTPVILRANEDLAGRLDLQTHIAWAALPLVREVHWELLPVLRWI
jgi:hypothetical protein